MSISFEGRVQQIGERLVVRLPDQASRELPSRGQVAVRGELGGHEFATVLEPDGRKGHWIAVNEQLRTALSLAAGARVSGAVSPTKDWPEPEVPEDLGTALSRAPDVEDTWQDITPMARWEWVRWIGATKNPETRERRVAVSLDKMRHGKRRPCCFDLSSCTDPEVSRSGKLIDTD